MAYILTLLFIICAIFDLIMNGNFIHFILLSAVSAGFYAAGGIGSISTAIRDITKDDMKMKKIELNDGTIEIEFIRTNKEIKE